MQAATRLLSPNEFSRWDEFVDQHPAGTIFHKTTWLRLVDPGIKIHVLETGGVIKAGLALIKTKRNRVTGYHIPPYTQYFSPLYSGGGSKNSLTEEHECITALLDSISDAKHMDFKLTRGHQSILPYHWKGFETSVTITHTVTGTLDNYLAQLNKNKLRELKKLLTLVDTNDLSIETSIKESELNELMRHTTERKKFDANEKIVTGIVMNAGDDIAKKILIRSKSHGLLAFGFFPYDKKAVYNLINASVRVEDPVLKTINLLMIYKAIEFALNTGRTFDFEGSMLKGVEAFCRLMGGTQVPVYRVQKSPSLQYGLLRAAKQIKNDRK